MTLPRASRTACEVKFSEGIRLIKCFCLFFSWRSSSISFPDSRILGWQSTHLLNDFIHRRVRLLEVLRKNLMCVNTALQLSIYHSKIPSAALPWWLWRSPAIVSGLFSSGL
jgi:hypothetical protein